MIRLLLFLLPFSLSALPIRFEFNQGQFSPSVVYAARGIVLTANGPVFPHGIRMMLTGARMRPPQPGPPSGNVRYFARDFPRTVPQFTTARYPDVYPGIDLVFRDGGGKLEYDFAVAPEADTRAIRIRFRGARRIAIESGELVVDGLRHQLPAAYQESGAARHYIAAAYRLTSGKSASNWGAIALCRWSSTPCSRTPPRRWLGCQTGNAVAVDTEGNAYLAGGTDSADFAL